MRDITASLMVATSPVKSILGLIPSQNATAPKQEKLYMNLLDLKGKLSVVGSGFIIRGNAIYSDEISLSFKLCMQFAADEEYKDLLSRIERQSSESNTSIDDMSGHEFESFCAELLRGNGFSDVEVTRGSGDQGIDVLATKDFVKYGFQCKC